MYDIVKEQLKIVANEISRGLIKFSVGDSKKVAAVDTFTVYHRTQPILHNFVYETERTCTRTPAQ